MPVSIRKLGTLAIKHRISIQDAIMLLAVSSAVLFFALEYDVFTDEGNPVRDQKEVLEFDELLCLGGILVFGLLVFSWRRMREYKKEVARRITAEQRAEASARHDSLTGLPNKRMFMELVGVALGRAWDRDSKCAVLFIDLDRFKPVNDTFGHAVGDALLIELAGRLRLCFPSPSVIARLGGDEFAAFVEYSDGEDVPALAARRALKEIQRPATIDGNCIEVSATLGVAIGPDDGRRAEDLIHAADLAMYEGKRSGRGSVQVFKAA